MTKRIFLSYTRADLKYAGRLAAQLRANANIEVWLDQDSLLPGHHWRTEIQKAIWESDYFVALLSENSVDNRGYVQAELKTALSVLSEVSHNKIFLIPARLDECQVTHPSLQELHWTDLFPDWDAGVSRIVQAINDSQPMEAEPERQQDKNSLPVSSQHTFSEQSETAPSPDSGSEGRKAPAQIGRVMILAVSLVSLAGVGLGLALPVWIWIQTQRLWVILLAIGFSLVTYLLPSGVLLFSALKKELTLFSTLLLVCFVMWLALATPAIWIAVSNMSL